MDFYAYLHVDEQTNYNQGHYYRPLSSLVPQYSNQIHVNENNFRRDLFWGRFLEDTDQGKSIFFLCKSTVGNSFFLVLVYVSNTHIILVWIILLMKRTET